MIGRQEELAGESAEAKVARIKSIARKRRVLEDDLARVRAEIRSGFSGLVEMVQLREWKLLRQAEAIHRQRISVAESNEEDEDDIRPFGVRAIFLGIDELKKRLWTFGRIQIRGTDSFRITNREPYEIAEYQDSSNDHVSFDKCIAGNSGSAGGLLLESSAMAMLTSDAAAASNGDGIGDGDGSSPAPMQTLDQPAEKSTVPTSSSSSCCCCCCSCSCSCCCRRCKGDLSASQTCKKDKTDHAGGKEVDTEKESEMENGGKESLERGKESRDANPGESRRSSDEGHPEQVRQWLEEILSETEIEPTIHEVEKLPEIYY